jgi:hypothetical protein
LYDAAVTITDRQRSNADMWVGLLTLAWLIATPVLLLLFFTSALREDNRASSLYLLAAAAAGVLLPVLAAVLAFRVGKQAMGTTYAVFAVLVLVPAIYLIIAVSDTFGGNQPATPPGPPGHCVEHSGGQAECPGG